MFLSTEVFVMIIYLMGFPLFYGMVKSSALPGGDFFILGYFALLLSNTFTVIEEFYLYNLFNTLEHTMLVIASILIFIAVILLTTKSNTKTPEDKNRDGGEKQ